ncbi:serine/threonine-protein kinase [Streptomyces jumonjinensis]|uniref:Serine/threonine protein kinase n=1 Tax=Streptomyces jumonjinensis TaxID=1945 RepID=A0A646KAM8_STRJU|nr:serine/threonine-protein kinase [Streptomyces jumonjinensis]MQS99187.1 serine/threonine protein kinase [Streptomyces jumonjinensis]
MTGSPTRIGRYTVARELGSGGMGEVYLAYSPAGSPVAVKVIRSDKLDPVTRARFEKEALIARTVIGTNRVARFLDADPFADRPWLAMEYVAGRTLQDCVDSDGALPLPLVASLGALLAEGLSAVHDAGLLHRDLKPQNVMLGSEGPMIIDFGLGAFMDAAKDTLSHSGVIIGTVRCMPPEQASGHPRVTPAADVYALGTVLLYAASRHYPYDGHQWEAVAMQVSNPEIGPDLSGVPEGLKALLAAMLTHTPEERPSLAEVADACADLMKAAGKTPADARLALISRTTAAGGETPTREPISTSLENLIDERAVIVGSHDLVSPLDIRPAAEEPEADEEPVPELTTAPARPKARTSRERPLASTRVAGELREQYAVNSTL